VEEGWCLGGGGGGGGGGDDDTNQPKQVLRAIGWVVDIGGEEVERPCHIGP